MYVYVYMYYCSVYDHVCVCGDMDVHVRMYVCVYM